MSNTQNFDTELIPKLKRSQEILSDAFKGIVPAFESSLELAHRNNIPILEKESSNGLEASKAVSKQAEELDESLTNLIQYYERMAEALA